MSSMLRWIVSYLVIIAGFCIKKNYQNNIIWWNISLCMAGISNCNINVFIEGIIHLNFFDCENIHLGPVNQCLCCFLVVLFSTTLYFSLFKIFH